MTTPFPGDPGIVITEERIRIDGMRLLSPNQTRGHTRQAAIIASHQIKAERQRTKVEVQLFVARKELRSLGAPAEIGLTRIGPRRLDDSNLANAFKAVEDGIAAALGLNDKGFVWFGARPGVRVMPEQRSEGPGVYAVEIVLRWEREAA